MKYFFDKQWTEKAKEIAEKLNYNWIIPERLSVVRSYGSKARRTIARIHCINKVLMLGMNQQKSFYVIELISENFDKQSENEKIETIVHELMHIPKTFGGGFRHHDHVCNKNVKAETLRYFQKFKEEF
ncbi:MAG: putative metallopeptidase [Candidatus Diapherotrites archaeon]